MDRSDQPPESFQVLVDEAYEHCKCVNNVIFLGNYVILPQVKELTFVTVLNSLLAILLTAINQYLVHSEICENWGYGKIHMATRKKAMDE